MTFEADRSQTAAVESDQSGITQVRLYECWPGGPIVRNPTSCPAPSERYNRDTSTQLPVAHLGSDAIEFPAESRAQQG